MVRRSVLAAAVVLFFGSPAVAQPPQLDAEARQPCLWRVVLATKPHPLLAADLRERVRRDVVAALQTGVGPLGTVEVTDLADTPRDRWEPLWQEFADKGFAALDAPRDLTGAKTHFLRLEYRDGQFHMEARQYDGFTGLASPLVRTRAVRAPDQIGRAAGLLLDRDFGLTGTVELNPATPDAVRVLVRGAGLGPIGALVERGDVFAVAAVRKTSRPAPAPIRTATGKIINPSDAGPTAYTSTPRPYVLLKVLDVGPDSLRCALLPGDVKALPMSGGVVGYRCMKLGTVKAPVAVRLVGSDGTVERTGSRVVVRANDALFPDAARPDLKDACTFHIPTAQFRAGRELTNVACVTVTLGAQSKLFAVPVLTADPITLPFEVNEAKARLADFQREVTATANAVADARYAQTVCFETVARLIDKQENKRALAQAQNGLAASEAAYLMRTDELKRLREGADIAPTAKPLLDKIERDLAALKQHNDKLKEHVGKIDHVVKLSENPALAAKEIERERLNERVRFLLAVGDVEQALVAYDQLLAVEPDAAKKAERDRVAAEWKIKDDAHQKARDYLLKTWPTTATIPDFKDSAVKQNNVEPPLRVAVDVCKKHGDKWTLRKLRGSFDAAGVRLNELVAEIGKQGAPSDADKKLLTDADATGKALAALEQEIRTFIGD